MHQKELFSNLCGEISPPMTVQEIDGYLDELRIVTSNPNLDIVNDEDDLFCLLMMYDLHISDVTYTQDEMARMNMVSFLQLAADRCKVTVTVFDDVTFSYSRARAVALKILYTLPNS